MGNIRELPESARVRRAAEAKAWLTAALVIILAGLIAVWLFLPEKEWIHAGKVDIAAATSGISSYTGVDQQFEDGEASTAFSHDCFFEGEYFRDEFIRDGKTLMRFTPEIRPGDGVPDAFMFALRRGGAFAVRIVVDDDFKNAMGDTDIVWGAQYQNTKPFSYKAVSKGIYTDEVPDDPARRADPFSVRGGVALGRITQEDIKGGNTNVTAIILH